MTKQEALQKINKVGETYTNTCMSTMPTNWTNGYMQAVRDCKAPFYGNERPMTNADRVRNMTDEELEAFIQSPCSIIRPDRKSCRFLCDECISKWLKEKVE